MNRFLIEDLCRDENQESAPREKAYKLNAHIGAMLGFDQDYGMRPASHLTAASVDAHLFRVRPSTAISLKGMSACQMQKAQRGAGLVVLRATYLAGLQTTA
jgi:hypothetical protein